jgi:hypothetical protein
LQYSSYVKGLDCKSRFRCCMSFAFSKYRFVCHVPSRNVPIHNDPKKIVPSTPIAAVGGGGGGDDDDVDSTGSTDTFGDRVADAVDVDDEDR